MNNSLEDILLNLRLGKDGIYNSNFVNKEQSKEIIIRENNAKKRKDNNYLDFIPNHHSIPVMEKEVYRALRMIKKNSVILDVGGGIGWHWKILENARKDVKVVILDFVRGNLLRAKELHKDIINKRIYLVHGDATILPFPENSFDLYWSVQALQHIKRFSKAVMEAKRILKPGGVFMNYSVNEIGLYKLIYKIFNKSYHIKGKVPGFIYLERGSDKQKGIIETVFDKIVKTRFTEILYHPGIKMWTGGENNIIGKMDANLGSSNNFLKLLANQRSFEVVKRN